MKSQNKGGAERERQNMVHFCLNISGDSVSSAEINFNGALFFSW